jgi:hypothetical protein
MRRPRVYIIEMESHKPNWYGILLSISKKGCRVIDEGKNVHLIPEKQVYYVENLKQTN